MSTEMLDNSNNILSAQELKDSKNNQRRRKLLALFFVTPLVIFIIVSFVLPIGTMLYRSFYNPTGAILIPQTLSALSQWDEKSNKIPNADILITFTQELKSLAKQRKAGKLAEEINRSLPGSSSLIKFSARKIAKKSDQDLAERGDQLLLALKKDKWKNPKLWHSIKKSGAIFTDRYYLTALDLKRNSEGEIVQRETKIYLKLFWKSLKIALYITLLTIIIGYPLSYYLSTAPTKTANILMVFVLLPFWTSLLVRTTSWIALLQTNGVVNSTLQSLHMITEPMDMLYNQFSTILAMTHILLPFMILPLYSVMKGIDPSYFRAALSLGGKPIPAFIRIYMPMTVPGISAGALLVFIISIGYYITPALVGGTDGQMISNIIAFHMQSSNNWELAAALGSLLLGLIIIIYWIYDRFVGISNIKLG